MLVLLLKFGVNMEQKLLKNRMEINGHVTTYICGPNAMKEWNGNRGDRVIISHLIDELFPEKMEKIDRSMQILFDDGESAKSLENYGDLCVKLMESGVDRTNTLWYVGGGTLGDLAGFVASTFKRGMGYSAIPTTFLSQIDSSIGGKNGVNISGTKNMVGTFRNPETIIADTEFVEGNASLIMDGLPEAIKHGFALDPSILEFLEMNDPEKLISGARLPEFIMKNAVAKSRICSIDPEETGETRFLLNFGHTVAHGIEAASGNAISHGNAVLVGMQMEIMIAEEIEGHLDGNPYKRLENIVNKYELKVPIIKRKIFEDAWTYMERDKKIRNGEINVPLMGKDNSVRVKKMRISMLKPAYWKTIDLMSA